MFIKKILKHKQAYGLQELGTTGLQADTPWPVSAALMNQFLMTMDETVPKRARRRTTIRISVVVNEHPNPPPLIWSPMMLVNTMPEGISFSIIMLCCCIQRSIDSCKIFAYQTCTMCHPMVCKLNTSAWAIFFLKAKVQTNMMINLPKYVSTYGQKITSIRSQSFLMEHHEDCTEVIYMKGETVCYFIHKD
jgi:hypothetical protein